MVDLSKLEYLGLSMVLQRRKAQIAATVNAIRQVTISISVLVALMRTALSPMVFNHIKVLVQRSMHS
jgi:hypothetical protein